MSIKSTQIHAIQRLIVAATFAFVIASCSDGGVATDSTWSSDPKTSNGEAYTPAASVEQEFASLRMQPLIDFPEPVDIATRTNDQALYIVSRKGLIAKLDTGPLRTVLDISDKTSGEGEQGLLGLAFSNAGDIAYLNYTNNDGDTVIASVSVAVNGDFNVDTLSTLLEIKQPYANHNGGDIVVEPSGSLLIATGDGGSGGDPLRVALDESSMLGKVLRLDPATGVVKMIAKGLRNPWRIDLYDNRLWLADVGQNEWEELNVVDGVTEVSGMVNFGWSAFEATTRFNADQGSASFQAPLVTYEHGDDGCSVSGGAVASAGSLRNRYVFADYCSGKVWSISTIEKEPTKELLFDDVDRPVAVVRALDDIYVLSLSGTIWRIAP